MGRTQNAGSHSGKLVSTINSVARASPVIFATAAIGKLLVANLDPLYTNFMAVVFDTLKFANKLKAAGVPDKQAEAEAEALDQVLEINLRDLATKQDLRELELRLEAKITPVRQDLTAVQQGLAAV